MGDKVREALERAFNWGQEYWQQADSESYSQNKKSAVTREKFLAFVETTCTALASPPQEQAPGCHGLDTPERVCFYEQDFYVLSNFSSFEVEWENRLFPTSEHAYHWEKFYDGDERAEANTPVAYQIMNAPSAHEAFKIAERNKHHRRPDWDAVKIDIMRNILREKARQHEYVRRKLLATGDRELVENSWRDDFWGWGPNRDGKNMLGRLWMEVRAELRSAAPSQEQAKDQSC